MKRVFTIEWPNGLGSMWMNKDNLELCLRSEACIGKTVPGIKVEDITDSVGMPAITVGEFLAFCLKKNE